MNRQEKIDKLVTAFVTHTTGLLDEDDFLDSMLRYGFEGYCNMTDEELDEECRMTFD